MDMLRLLAHSYFFALIGTYIACGAYAHGGTGAGTDSACFVAGIDASDNMGVDA